jgi:hypothetical protein
MSRIETSMNQRVSLRDRGFKSIRESVQNPETCWIFLFIVFGCLLRLIWARILAIVHSRATNIRLSELWSHYCTVVFSY